MRTGALPRVHHVLGLGLLLAAGCKGAKADVKLSKQATSLGEDAIPNVPVPTENGPQLFVVRPGAKVLDRPSAKGQELGELLLGGSVARAADPIVKRDSCPNGYYPVRPRGFVCLDEKTSLVASPAVHAPNLEHALPYRYGRTISPTPVYNRIPSAEEQAESEPNLEKHLSKATKNEAEPVKAGANDVPLDERGVPSGPPVISKIAEGVGDDGKRTRGSFFAFGDELPPPILADKIASTTVATVLKKGSAVAVSSTFLAEGPAGRRRFGVLPDGTFIPVDRLEPVVGTTWHGVDLKDKGLPLAFILKHEVNPFTIENGKAKRLEDEDVDRRSVVHLTNKWRSVDGVRYEETDEGNFFREKDVIKIVKRTKFPDFVKGDTKWIDVGLALQTMTLYEGKKPVYSTLVSSGQDVLGDPATSAATVQGTFKIERKSISSAVDPKESHEAFDVLSSPYAIEFAPGVAFRSVYWADNAGEARSYHDVALAPLDAKRLFTWAGPEIPTGWSSVVPAEADQIVVYVRK